MSIRPDQIALLGLDIGTTTCKVIAFAPGGEIVAQASATYAVSAAQPGFAELDPNDILAAIRQVLGAIATDLSGFGKLAMAISAQGEAFVLVDRAGEALSPAPVSVDARGAGLIAALAADPANRQAAEDAGQDLTAISSLAKLLWFRDAPDRLLERSDKALCMGEFFMAQLGLAPVTDLSMAARMGLLDSRTLTWSSALLSIAGLPASLLPPASPSARLVGAVPAETMEKWGIDKPVDVYTGGHDQACAMLGAGITGTSTALYSIGTTEAIAIPATEPPAGLRSLHAIPYPHVVAGQSVILIGSQHGGRVLQWLTRLTGETDPSAILAELPDAPSALIFIPHLGSSGTVRDDLDARGTFHGLDYSTTRGGMALAVLEGITMEQAHGVSALNEKGLAIDVLRTVGGGTRSDAWMQLKADILGLPIECLDQPDTACAGAAILAGRGAGVLPDSDGAAERFISVRRRFEPRPDRQQVYALKRDLYERIYRATADLRQHEQGLRRAIEQQDKPGKRTREWQG